MNVNWSAFDNVTALPDDPQRLPDGVTSISAHAAPQFVASTRGLLDHDVLTPDEEWIARHDYYIAVSTRFDWQAGTYLEYGQFRQTLAAIAGWEIFTQCSTPEQPFYEIVHFSDSEGCIGHEAARDVLADFTEYRDAYLAAHADTPYVDHYDAWITGLTLAADNGIVWFHS